VFALVSLWLLTMQIIGDALRLPFMGCSVAGYQLPAFQLSKGRKVCGLRVEASFATLAARNELVASCIAFEPHFATLGCPSRAIFRSRAIFVMLIILCIHAHMALLWSIFECVDPDHAWAVPDCRYMHAYETGA
jgi:hypothetical protein